MPYLSEYLYYSSDFHFSRPITGLGVLQEAAKEHNRLYLLSFGVILRARYIAYDVVYYNSNSSGLAGVHVDE